MNQSHASLEQLVEYVHGQLPAAQDAQIHEHLAECRSCSDAYEGEARLTELLRSHARTNERDLPETVIVAVRNTIDHPRRATVAEPLRAALRPVLLLPAAAAVVAALYLGTLARHSSANAPSINAAYYMNNHAALTAAAPFSEDAPVPALLTTDDMAAEQQPANEPH